MVITGQGGEWRFSPTAEGLLDAVAAGSVGAVAAMGDDFKNFKENLHAREKMKGMGFSGECAVREVMACWLHGVRMHFRGCKES